MNDMQFKPRSDLGVRTASGVAMMSIAIAAVWLGGFAFMALVIIISLGVFWEFTNLVFAFSKNTISRMLWLVGGIFYVGLACFALLLLSSPFLGMTPVIILIAGVIGTDVGAYFAGRSFGGPKIAPKISPSKTWSGLVGGIISAGPAMIAAQALFNTYLLSDMAQAGIDVTGRAGLGFEWMSLIIAGCGLAITAQAGDFFESWMKRRAGVKDSGRLIPGHGGLFDRMDGLIAVAFGAGAIVVLQSLVGSL